METKLYQEMYELESQHWWFRARREILTSLIWQYLPQGKILDVGCGTGFILEAFKTESASKYEAWGIDIEAIAVQVCHDKGLTQVTQGVLEKNSLPEHDFDLVMFLDMIEHLDHDLSALLMAKHYLKPQGQILITVPAYQFLWSAHDEIHHHKRRYTKKSLTELLNQAGYEIVFVSYLNTFLFPLIVITRLVGNLNQRHHSSDAKLPSTLINNLLYQVFKLEKNLLSQISLPFGVSIVCLAKNRFP
ncbi:class I SAM-dependent methyltransferase [Pseudanabaena sp. FACHB-1277]|jgi:2-polyprenyl-3-methyl-5-hydroxy-6-metoxy-1,4-benzoquinol methylase|uniref:Class I SAM-dependent methyltransferase n=1 Tax=Pseudanabaena cinerea FACHB-1277 TaxID=2949581 RepID=A0A926UPQ6_9CYAN|nr:class I SAM-dependent methyltransferase [Pseudanabaena cinerea]MBD2148742.1 class I SAM-dependent methyltransferase [Pseudanabaena cinerea FACHB-1277]